MQVKRKRQLMVILSILIGLGVALALILYALRQNISLFYSPTDLAHATKTPFHRTIRVGGVVVPGSIIREKGGLSVRFRVTDYQRSIEIVYHGILPDLFREGQGIVARGQLLNKRQFEAAEVLAKHDEKYMPPEVKSSLKATT